MELCVRAPRGGAASSRRDDGEGFGAAAGADRTQSCAAGCKAVSVESAVAQSAVLRGAAGCGGGDGGTGRWRYGALPWGRWEAADCARAGGGRLAGLTDAATDVAQAGAGRADSTAGAGRSAAVDSRASVALEGSGMRR